VGAVDRSAALVTDTFIVVNPRGGEEIEDLRALRVFDQSSYAARIGHLLRGGDGLLHYIDNMRICQMFEKLRSP
jgi:hypothetical protein